MLNHFQIRPVVLNIRQADFRIFLHRDIRNNCAMVALERSPEF